jgi:hypothetical protein
MNAWSAIQYVGSGLSLVAFVVAIALFAYRARLKQRARIIQSAPAADRLKAIEATAEFFNVDVSGVPPEQKYKIVMAQIQLRARRELLFAGVSLAIAVLLAIVAIVAILGNRSSAIASREHTEADESYYIAASTVLNLAKRALEIFESSEVSKKRALLNFMLQNSVVDRKKPLYTLRSPFDTIYEYAKHPTGLRTVEAVRTWIASHELFAVPILVGTTLHPRHQ